MFEITKSKQVCFKTGIAHFENGVNYCQVVIPLSSLNRQGHMGVMQYVREDSLKKKD